MFGQEAFRAKMSHWLGWANERGLKESDRASFMSLLDSLERYAPALFYSKTLQGYLAHTAVETSALSSGRWPSSGILSGGVCLTANTSESPNLAKESTLLGVIETSTVPDRYFLNPSAAVGMLRRADRMGRPLFLHLRQSLEILSGMARSSNPSPIVSTPVQRATRGRTGAAPTSNTRVKGKSDASLQKSVRV